MPRKATPNERTAAASPPHPFGPVPSPRQLAWHELGFYGFIHFTVNTFTDKEWGYGDESPAVFNPSACDPRQWASVARRAGMKGLILTCKHHDGFCLWPSRFTEHCVRRSPWRGGKGDLVREFVDACRAEGLKPGVYLSPWDRNHAAYGRPEYVTYYRNQLRELLTGYGPIFEVWFDGANGGDGFYGGARETRTIDKFSYYGWADTWRIVRDLQPGAVMFSDAGPDVRWVGNEAGIAGDPCWATVNSEKVVPGDSNQELLNSGERPGGHWMPAECCVSIRPGWFYHAAEDDKVRSPENLAGLYFRSVGRGASLLLNLPPDRRGLVHERDVAAVTGMRDLLDQMLGKDLAPLARISASHTRGTGPRFAGARVADGLRETYWCTPDEVTAAELVLDFPEPVTFGVVSLREHLPLGQRIDSFALDTWQGDAWCEFASGSAIGSRRLVRVAPLTTSRLRVRITQAAACPTLSEVAVYAAP